MHYILGFITWIVIGVIAAGIMRFAYRVARTDAWLTFAFGFFGAFIGGMLGTSGYVHHDPNPFRFGGILGAVLGSLFFTAVYHFSSDKAV